jgi:hypothetical protein
MYKPQHSHHDVAAVPDQIILVDGFDFFQESIAPRRAGTLCVGPGAHQRDQTPARKILRLYA